MKAILICVWHWQHPLGNSNNLSGAPAWNRQLAWTSARVNGGLFMSCCQRTIMCPWFHASDLILDHPWNLASILSGERSRGLASYAIMREVIFIVIAEREECRAVESQLAFIGVYFVYLCMCNTQECKKCLIQSADVLTKRMSWYKMIMGFEVAWWMYLPGCMMNNIIPWVGGCKMNILLR